MDLRSHVARELHECYLSIVADRARRTRIKWVRWSAGAGALAACVGLSSVLLLESERGPLDPTRKGPLRTLSVQEARLTDRGQLEVSGSTNFPDGVSLEVLLVAEGTPLASYPASVRQGRFDLSVPTQGEVVAGNYRVSAQFRLERQPEHVRQALGYQPASLAASAPLSLPLQLVAQATARDELESLLEAVNLEPRDTPTLDDLDRRAQALADRLWIAKEKLAVQKLRLAIEVARRPGALLRRDFDRLLLEAHVIAGL